MENTKSKPKYNRGIFIGAMQNTAQAEIDIMKETQQQIDQKKHTASIAFAKRKKFEKRFQLLEIKNTLNAFGIPVISKKESQSARMAKQRLGVVHDTMTKYQSKDGVKHEGEPGYTFAGYKGSSKQRVGREQHIPVLLVYFDAVKPGKRLMKLQQQHAYGYNTKKIKRPPNMEDLAEFPPLGE